MNDPQNRPATGLTAQDRHLIDLARQLAAIDTIAAAREEAGADGTTDGTIAALTHFWGAARVALADVAAIAERLGGDEGQVAGPGEDSRRLGEIRALLARFDWERDDRRYALEAIDRIAGGGEDDQENDDDQADDHWRDYNYTCSTCGALIGMFIDRQGWQHYRGDGTTASPVEIYDASHEATFAGGQP